MAGTQCCATPPSLDGGSGGGAVVDLGGLRCYAVGREEAGAAVLLVSDVFGFEAPNFRKIADKIAADGFYVVAPDFFYGDPFAPDNAERPLSQWIKTHSPEKGLKNAQTVVAALKNKGMSSVGAAGFCWGGKIVSGLAKSKEIETGVLVHPALVKPEDIKEVKIPLAIIAAEVDFDSPPALIKQFEEILSSNKQLESFVKIFPGVSHGWTVRYEEDDEFTVMRAEEAHQDLLDWLKKILRA